MSAVSEVLSALSGRGKEIGYIARRPVHARRLRHEYGESFSSTHARGTYTYTFSRTISYCRITPDIRTGDFNPRLANTIVFNEREMTRSNKYFVESKNFNITRCPVGDYAVSDTVSLTNRSSK